ncbi:hypothetical protein ACFLX3_05145 [Chloroflexota bacterium]
MSKKISIQEKKKWLDMFEQGLTEVQIARKTGRDSRTIVKGIEEASKEKRLASTEAEMLRNALFKHQDQLTGLLKNIVEMLVLPPYDLKLREESEGILAPIPLTGALLKQISKEQLILEIHNEDKLEWELLKEHLKQDKLWEDIKQWRDAMLDHIWVRCQFKLAIQSEVAKNVDPISTNKKDKKQLETAKRDLVDLFFDVVTQRILGIRNETDMEKAIDFKMSGFEDKGVSRQKLVAIFDLLPGTKEAYKLKSTFIALAGITKLAKKQADEIMLLNMITGKCRVCRRLGL